MSWERWPLLILLGQAAYSHIVQHSLPEAGFWILIASLVLIAWEIRDLRREIATKGRGPYVEPAVADWETNP